jgi:hypothetical protein
MDRVAAGLTTDVPAALTGGVGLGFGALEEDEDDAAVVRVDDDADFASVLPFFFEAIRSEEDSTCTNNWEDEISFTHSVSGGVVALRH